MRRTRRSLGARRTAVRFTLPRKYLHTVSLTARACCPGYDHRNTLSHASWEDPLSGPSIRANDRAAGFERTGAVIKLIAQSIEGYYERFDQAAGMHGAPRG